MNNTQSILNHGFVAKVCKRFTNPCFIESSNVMLTESNHHILFSLKCIIIFFLNFVFNS